MTENSRETMLQSDYQNSC